MVDLFAVLTEGVGLAIATATVIGVYMCWLASEGA